MSILKIGRRNKFCRDLVLRECELIWRRGPGPLRKTAPGEYSEQGIVPSFASPASNDLHSMVYQGNSENVKVFQTGFILIMFLILSGGGRVTVCEGFSWIGINLHEHHCEETNCDTNHEHGEEDCDCGGEALLFQFTFSVPTLDSISVESPPLFFAEEISIRPRAPIAFLKVSHPPPQRNSGVSSCALLQRFIV